MAHMHDMTWRADRWTGRQTDRLTKRWTEAHRQLATFRHTGRQADMQTKIQKVQNTNEEEINQSIEWELWQNEVVIAEDLEGRALQGGTVP